MKVLMVAALLAAALPAAAQVQVVVIGELGDNEAEQAVVDAIDCSQAEAEALVSDAIVSESCISELPVSWVEGRDPAGKRFIYVFRDGISERQFVVGLYNDGYLDGLEMPVSRTEPAYSVHAGIVQLEMGWSTVLAFGTALVLGLAIGSRQRGNP